MIKKFVGYFRVSTARQGQSGLGLEAQRKAVLDHINGNGSELVAEFVEVESGKIKDRPELTKALAACRKHKATLIIAKLDRLARNLHFVSGLLEAGIDFVCCDNPHANKLTIQLLAVMAEHERDMISQRTKDALAAAKARGVVLGGPKVLEAGELGRAALQAAADQRAGNVKPIIAEIKAAGITSLRGIAAALTARGITTPRGGAWHPQTVKDMLAR